MRRSTDYGGLAVLESGDSKQPVDITIHVTSTHPDAETMSASGVQRDRGAIEVWVRDDVMDLLVETDTLTILARSPVGGFAIVRALRLDMVAPLANPLPDVGTSHEAQHTPSSVVRTPDADDTHIAANPSPSAAVLGASVAALPTTQPRFAG